MDALTEQQVLADLRTLDPFSQRELLDFLAFLRSRRAPQQPKSATNTFEIYAGLDLAEEQAACPEPVEEAIPRRPKKTQTEIRQVLAATRGSLPGKKTKHQIDREMRQMRDEWVREWE